jgi:trk system potassium uptake protein TrkA
MLILIVGCGRVGSSVARAMLREGHEVSCLDEDPESHARLEVGLEKSWEDLGGQFTVGAGLESEALVAAGIERADAFIASTDGDNTNIVIAQIAQKRYEVPTVIARVLDPLRAEWYQRQGLNTVCPTSVAIDRLEPARRPGGSRVEKGTGEPMYIIVVGAGKVGWNLARELLEKNHEVTLIENNRRRYLTVEQELEHNVSYGDASELWVLERAGIQRADMVIAVTGDDEDNMLICQVAREKYLVERIIARVNNPRNRQHFDLLGVKPSVSATDLILRLLEHEVPEYGLVHLLDLQEEQLEIIEMLLGQDSDVTGRRVGDLEMPEGSLLISILRSGKGFVPGPDTVLEAGDEVLAVLDPGKEDDIKALFGPGNGSGTGSG